jgi:hypothetical protein
MSFIARCDVCGKDGTMTGVTFSNQNEPLMTKVTGYDGIEYLVFSTMSMMALEDYERIKRVSAMYLGESEYEEEDEDETAYEEDYEEEYEAEGEEEEEDQNQLSFFQQLNPGETLVRLKHPMCMACDACKRELTRTLANNGTFAKNVNTNGTEATSCVRTEGELGEPTDETVERLIQGINVIEQRCDETEEEETEREVVEEEGEFEE